MTSKTPKVCLVANSGFTILNFREELITNLVSQGCDVVVICPDDRDLLQGKEIEAELRRIGARYIPVSLSRNKINPVSEFATLLSLCRSIRAESPDLVLNYTIKASIYGSLAAWFAGTQMIASNITGLGSVFTGTGFKAQVLRILIGVQYKIALSTNHVVFFQNPDDRNEFCSRGLLRRSKTRVINGSGVDLNKFRRYGPASNNQSFVFVGRLLWDKGIREFVEAATILKRRYPAAVFTVLGPMDDNPYSLDSESLDNYIESGVIQYIGAVDDVRPVLEDHEVFVLPSYREGTPRAVLEAMSMSMPIITCDTPGCRETVVHGSNGYLVEVGDSIGLAMAMERFIRDPELVVSFGVKSCRLAREKYDVKKVNESILREFAGVLPT